MSNKVDVLEFVSGTNRRSGLEVTSCVIIQYDPYMDLCALSVNRRQLLLDRCEVLALENLVQEIRMKLGPHPLSPPVGRFIYRKDKKGNDIFTGNTIQYYNHDEEKVRTGKVVDFGTEVRIKDEGGFVKLWDDGEKDHYSIELLDFDEVLVLDTK